VPPRSPRSPSAASIRTARSSATAFGASPVSPMPSAPTRSSRPAQVRAQGGTHAGLQMGQYGARQHQRRHYGNLTRDQRQARPALPRRIRIPLQPTLRSGGEARIGPDLHSPPLAATMPQPRRAFAANPENPAEAASQHVEKRPKKFPLNARIGLFRRPATSHTGAP
jgi:hypothetical protein